MPPAAAPRSRAGASAAVVYPPGAHERLVEFPNCLNQKLSGLFVSVDGSEDVVILCHGYCSSRNGFRMPEIAKELATKKVNTLRFDFSGNGASEGVFDFAGYEREVGDLRAAVLFVRSTLNKTVTAILGHSKGGNIVLMYSARHDDVPLVVNVAGRFDMKRGLEERFGADMIAKVMKMGQVPLTAQTDTGKTIKYMLTKQSLSERMEFDMEEVCKNVTIAEVMTLHGSEDSTIPVEDAHSIAKVVRNHTLHVITGADHNFTERAHSDQLVKKISEFILAGL